MPGYEDLTPDQLIYLTNLISIVVMFWSTSYLIRAIFYYLACKNINVKIEDEIVKEVKDKIKKETFFDIIKNWWMKRKKKKEGDFFYE